MGKRKGTHGDGTWAVPGGHLEFGEDLVSCAQRELFEETGLNADNLTIFTVTNNIFKEEQKHSITIFFIGRALGESPQVKELDKCEQWQWFSLDDLPEDLFLPVQILFQNEKLKEDLRFTINQNTHFKNVA